MSLDKRGSIRKVYRTINSGPSRNMFRIRTDTVVKPSPGMLFHSVSEKFLQLSTLLLLTVQNTALVLLTKFSYRTHTTPYVVSTVIVFSELSKLIVSSSFVVFLEGRVNLQRALKEIPTSALRLSVPSLLYVIQNNLLFEGVRLLSPVVYTVSSQSKIFTSALFSTILLKTRITRKQSLALFGLMIGMIFVQIGDEVIVKHADRESDAPLRGFFIVMAASLTSGFAGAYLEKMYKEVDVSGLTRSIWFRNTQLACFSMPIAVCMSIFQDGRRILSFGVFAGYNNVVVIIIALQAFGGLVVAAVMRYASNVLKCFAVSLSICVCTFATSYILDDGVVGLSAHQDLGIVLVIGATFAYASK